MHTKIIVTSVLAGIALAGSVLAAPAGVTGIVAGSSDGVLSVRWDAPAGDIAFYRVYFSRTSIMQNNGTYDDYERTAGNETSYTFPSVPYTDTTLYISVLAVDAQGAESPAFLEEASVVIPPRAAQSSSTSFDLPIPELPVSSQSSSQEQASSMSSSSAGETVPFLMTHVLTMSPTELAVYFTKPISPASQISTGSVVIVSASGAKLDIMSVRIDGMAVFVRTVAQDDAQLYSIAGIGAVIAEDGTALAPASSPIAFRGHPDDGPAASSQSSSMAVVDNVPPADARNLRLRSIAQPDGTYRIEAVWEASTASDLSAYVLENSRDGRTFGGAQEFPSDKTTVRYDKVAPGTFGVMVRAKDIAGNISQGISKVIDLPQTGPVLLGVMMTAGALAGFRASKQKSRRK